MKTIIPPRRILIIMLRRIGDVLLTTPAVRALRKLYPHAKIDFLTEPPCTEILAGNPDIDEILGYGKASGPAGIINHARWVSHVRQRKYDWVIDYLGNPRSAVLTFFSGAAVKAGPGHVAHRWAYSHPLIQSDKTCYAGLEKIRMLHSLGIEPDESDCLPRLSVPENFRAWAKSTMSGFIGSNDSPLIGLIPSSRKITRRWPAESYARLGRILSDKVHARVIVFWGPGEAALARDIAQNIGPAARPSPETRHLLELAALIEYCRMVVTNCNGPKHLAVACRVPALTIHGSSDPDSWNPPDHPLFPFIRRSELPCIGCRHNECPHPKNSFGRDGLRYLECLRELTPETAAQEAMRLLQCASVKPLSKAVTER